MVQSRVDIAKTEMGINKEIRVSVMDGEPVFGRLRFSNEYMPDDIKEAEKFTRDFFAKAPPEIRHLSAGVDIGKTTDGKWSILEFNFGSSDGTLNPDIFPIQSNELVSSLQGKPTTLVQKLQKVFESDFEAQKKYMASLKERKPLWWKKNIDDLSPYEVGHWLRDQYLAQWRKNPSRASADELMKKLEELYAPDLHHQDFKDLLKGAGLFFQRELRKQK